MFCMNCGQKLPDEAKFCFRCGSKVCIEGIKKVENEKSVFEQDMPDEFTTLQIWYNHRLFYVANRGFCKRAK